jgi:predicted enzyme related to lactoylglutathione lyase
VRAFALAASALGIRANPRIMRKGGNAMNDHGISRRELLGAAAALALASGARAEGATAGAAPAPTRHFGFMKLVVGDLEKCAAFYESALGLVRQRRIDFAGEAGKGTEILYEPTAPGAAMFVLIHYDDTPKPAHGELILGFYTNDIDALVARVTAAGGTVDRAPYAIPEMKLMVAFVRDVEGHVIEVLEQAA